MTDLAVAVVGAAVEPYAAEPTLLLRLRITERGDEPVHALALRAQIQIAPQRRAYGPGEADRLYELFGEGPQWGESLRPFLWTHVGLVVNGFEGVTEVDLPVRCTYDFEVAAAKYLHALDAGVVPLTLLFSGTVFSQAGAGLSVAPVAWHTEAAFALPVATWREVMDRYFPGAGWVRLRQDTIDRLQHVKARRALTTWDDLLEQLLTEAGEGEVPPAPRRSGP